MSGDINIAEGKEACVTKSVIFKVAHGLLTDAYLHLVTKRAAN